MDNNWTILPEFDEGHQNRYIVMLSDRSVADDVAKKFPKICSEPFELKNDKYSWGLYVDNSTRDDRKNIYKFFLGETESEQELKREEEIKEVISDLNNIFSALTKAEQRHIEEGIPEKIESIEKFAEKKPEEKNAVLPADVISAEDISAIKKEAKPQDAALVMPVTSTELPPQGLPSVVSVAHSDVPILVPETKTEILPLSVSVETKQETPKDLKIEIERFGEPASSSVSSYPAKKEVSVASSPAVMENAVPPAASSAGPATTTEQSSSTESIKVGYLYPLPSPESLEKFISQLKMITEKSMKIPIYLEKVSETGYNTTGPNDFNSIIAAAKLKKADIILAVIPDGIDDIRLFIDTACRRNEILYMVAQQSQLDKKFLFVDMAIELLLIKKKLR
ncbi:MAG: hypothetical protein Q7K21_04425 [Elusimicrobiota bacterium]|nr:hypothetical protein [Elusimicrobiota bacterium]